MMEKNREANLDECEVELMRQLSHCCARAPVEGKHKLAAIYGVLFAMMDRRDVDPAAASATFASMWNESYAGDIINDPVKSIDLLAVSLGQIFYLPQPSRVAKMQGLLSTACRLVKGSTLNGTQFVELFLNTWRRFMHETPLGGLSEMDLAAGRHRARELEAMVAGWTDLATTAVLGLLVRALCLSAQRAPASKALVHRLIDDHWEHSAPMEPAS